MRLYLSLITLFGLLLTIIPPASAQVTFTDVTEAAGLGFFKAAWSTWGDYDNDGDADVVLLGAGRRLYRNEGNGTFLDVSETVGIIAAYAAIFLDFNNDGNLDLFISSSSDDVLYRNRGDGAFLNVSQEAGMESKKGAYYGALAFDYDNDGLLDIYVVAERNSLFPNLLYHNEGNGRFKEIAAQLGLDKPVLNGGAALGDYDNDEDLDIFIGNPGPIGPEQGIDVLYRNEEGGAFIDVAQQAGVQRKSNHLSVFFWDYDNDEDLDLFVPVAFLTDADGSDILYRNNGNGTFTDVTQQAGIAQVKIRAPVETSGTIAGAYYGDYDNDGWLDLCITHNDMPTLFYHNNGNGTFTEVGSQVGIGGTNTGTVNFVDYDNDGYLDIFTGAFRGDRVRLYRNERTTNHWLKLKLVGSQSNHDAIGTQVKVRAGNLSMLREIAGSSGLGNQQDRLPLHFGLGKNQKADLIEIRWPSGIIQTLTDIEADQQLTINELEGALVVVHNVFPVFGDPKGGTPVGIQGEGFIPGSKVFFGEVEVSEVRVESPMLITAITPPSATGLVEVSVVRPDGKRSVLKDGFRYTTLRVTRITPESGPITGGITVQIDGFGFQPGAEVLIGGRRLTNAFVTPTLIRGTLPPGAPGVVDVSVTNPTGERDVLRKGFTYVPPPTIEKVSPIFVGLHGLTEMVIKGSGFIRTPTVQIGGVGAQRVEFISENELKIFTPPLLAVGPQDVVVINPDGQRALLPGGVTVLAPIKIKSVEPKSGGLEGGTKITIVGEPVVEFQGRSYPSNFVEGVEVFIGDEEAEGVTVQSDHVITAITSPNTPGPKDVEVTNPDGQWDRLENAFTYNPFPQIQKVIPNNGRLSGGTKITIQGSGFLPGAKVLIKIDEGSFVAASEVQVVSPVIITAQTPYCEPGPKDVLVRNPDGQEAILREGFIYNPLPKITDISPNYGVSSGGAKIIIRGTGFILGAKVMIGKRPATTEVIDDRTIEAVTPSNPQGVFDLIVVNPDAQEAVKLKGFISVGEVAYNYPNPFRAERGTTFRYVTNERVESITVKIFNLAGVPIDVVGQTGSNEVRWHNAKIHAGLYVYLIEVKLYGGEVKKFRRALEVYK